MTNDTLFRGATRPPMFLGVPVTPLMIAGLLVLLPSVYFSLKYAFAFIPVFVIMQALVKIDEQIFELLGLRIKTGVMMIANPRSLGRDRLVLPHACRRDNWY
jgi:type IV secretion system protein VirB3